MGMRRVRNRQFGTTVRRDAPRGNAAARVKQIHGGGNAMPKFAQMPLTVMPALVAGIHAFLSFSNKAWMAGTSPAMTNPNSERVARLLRGACHRAGQRPDP